MAVASANQDKVVPAIYLGIYGCELANLNLQERYEAYDDGISIYSFIWFIRVTGTTRNNKFTSEYARQLRTGLLHVNLFAQKTIMKLGATIHLANLSAVAIMSTKT
ncbi:unnamed protein product [Ceratitis capitata]|uniref:(Mediterranean fruit fly) hypothetical protein n=1 Tax=Ceratitis capitata TaxID=7213 RepID=A0A811UNS4_CERCA|nr:unnamed protein product [Ceratitis capitata]